MAGLQSATYNQTNARTSPRRSWHPKRSLPPLPPENQKNTDGHPTSQDPRGQSMFSSGQDVMPATIIHLDPVISSLDLNATPIKPRRNPNPDKHSQRALRMRDAVARFLDDTTGFLKVTGLQDHVDTSAPSHRTHWAKPRSSADGRHSSEWETETLLDHSRGSLEMETQPRYPCPFRQRNPVRFNIRDHEECARAPFDTIHGLKRHIITCHRRRSRQIRCRRCRLEFDDEVALEDHLLLPRDQICEVVPPPSDDAEDGIMEQGRRLLAAGVFNGEAWSWEGIWQLLFPSDTEIPQPEFSPPVELVEVEQAFDDGQRLLKTSLRDKLGLLLPDVADNDYLNFLAGQLELVFETHRVDIMKQAVTRLGSARGVDQEPTYRPNRRSRRSILLQSIRRPSPEVAKRFSRDNTRSFSDRILSRTIRLDTADPPTQSPNTIEDSGLQTANERPQSPNNSTYEAAYLRDPRDSGISMLCDDCNLEPCSCSHADHFHKPQQQPEDEAPRSGKEQEQHGNTDPHRGGMRRQTHNPGAAASSPNEVFMAAAPTPPRQPRLSIKTGNLDLRRAGGGIERVEMSSSSSATSAVTSTFSGGRFSPESFKQRVLRQQLLGV